MSIEILTCEQSDATEELEHCFIQPPGPLEKHSSSKTRNVFAWNIGVYWRRHQLTDTDLNELARLLRLWLCWGKSGPNCPSLRLPLLHTHTLSPLLHTHTVCHTPRMWWRCMHRRADTQVTLMDNTRTTSIFIP